MRNLKKVLALVLAFSMMLSVVAFAGYKDVPADADYAGAVELLSALGIIKGDDLGNFNPDNTITRAEYAAIVCRALGLENAAAGAAGITAFTDVAADHWAAGYINLATQNGIINGYGDGKFGPEDKVTYEQAVKMLVCALGFEPMAAQKGGYPTGYLVVANQYKVTAGVSASVEAPRKTVAQLVYNALSTPKMDQTSYGVYAEWQVLDGKNDRDYATLLTDRDIYIASGVVSGYDKGNDEVTFAVKEDSDDFEFDEGKNVTFNVNGSEIANYRTQYVDVYVEKISKKAYDVLAVIPSVEGTTLTINSDDIYDVVGGEIEYYVDDSSKTDEIDLDTVVEYDKDGKVSKEYYAFYVNGAKKVVPVDKADLKKKLTGYTDAELTFVENTGDNDYDLVRVVEYYSARVDEVDLEDEIIRLNNREKIVIDEDSDVEYVFVDAKGEKLALADFAEDDVVAYVSDMGEDVGDAKEYIRIVKLTENVITGTVTEANLADDEVWIDDVKYELTAATAKEVDLGYEGTFYISMTGKIFDCEGSKAAGDYAVILGAGKDGTAVGDDNWIIELITAEGGVATYETTKDGNTAFGKIWDAVKDTKYTVETKDDTKIGDDSKLSFAEAKLMGDKAVVVIDTNSKGKITDIEYAVDQTDVDVKPLNDEYKANRQKLGSFEIADDVVVYDIAGDDSDEAYVADINYLVDDTEYKGFVVEDDDEVVCVISTVETGKFTLEDAGFAIVTEKKNAKVDGEKFVYATLLSQMEEVKVTFTEDSKNRAAGDKLPNYNDLGIGDVIAYTANAEGIVTKYAIIGQIADDGDYAGTFVPNTAALTDTVFAEENSFVYGYIANEKGDYKSETIRNGFDSKEYDIEKTTNTYSYYDARSKYIEVKTDYITENADWAELDDDDKLVEATFFFAGLFDDEVVDIYTFDQRVKKDDIDKYKKFDTWTVAKK